MYAIQKRNKDEEIKALLAGTSMLRAVAACFECRRPAFWKCAVTNPTVRTAGLKPADHCVGAA